MDIFEQMKLMEEKRKAHGDKGSANFFFCQEAIYQMLIKDPLNFYVSFGTEENVRKYCLDYPFFLLDQRKENLFGVEEVKNLKIHFKLDSLVRLRAIIFELSNAELEGDCNFAAVVFGGGIGSSILLSELYADGSYGLCEVATEQQHNNFGDSYGDIRDIDDMWDAIQKRGGIPNDIDKFLNWRYNPESDFYVLVENRFEDDKAPEILGVEINSIILDDGRIYTLYHNKEKNLYYLVKSDEFDGLTGVELEDKIVFERYFKNDIKKLQ